VAAIVVLTIYHGMRIAASECTGGACDVYIPLSLALPVAAIVVAAMAAARGTWRIAVAVTLLLSVAGPPVALAIWRDSPDVFVPVATVLIPLCPICVLAFWYFALRPKT
jgi:hypothetical protein